MNRLTAYVTFWEFFLPILLQIYQKIKDFILITLLIKMNEKVSGHLLILFTKMKMLFLAFVDKHTNT